MICGQATDATSGIPNTSAITLTITQATGAKTWNGSSFASGTNTVHPTSYSPVSGLWTYSFASTNLPADGSYSVSVVATDAFGNAQTVPATNTFNYDTAAETATISAPTYINSSTKSSVSISGTADPNASISVAIHDPGSVHTTTVTTTANGSGAWSKSSIDLSGFNDGTISFALSETDAAGNQGTASTTGTKDTVAPALGPPTAVQNTGSNGTVSGAAGTAPGDATTVTVSIDNGGTVTTPNPTVTNGSYSTAITMPTKTTYNVTVTQTDAAGNTTTRTTTVTRT
jgi:hypothetical protein